MGNPKGFLEVERKDPGYRDIKERLRDYNEVELRLGDEELVEQASRCMDCGVPFCHGGGCPLCNIIPEWNDLIYNGHWREALELLLSTNNFPEFTGKICPAPCEAACTVGLNGKAVTIRQIELALVEKGFEKAWIKPSPPELRSNKKVAVIGSGPAGLAIADQLNKMGHKVTVFEREPSAGGLLRYGIPDFKLDKKFVQRRIDLMKEEGISFEFDIDVGVDVSVRFLQKRFDAVCLACGARAARLLPVPGGDLKGVYLAMDFLSQQNRKIAGEPLLIDEISVKNKNVVVIGGGDTGSDCVGTSNRNGAKSVTQIEIMPKPPKRRFAGTPWPEWPYQLRTSSSHLEGCERIWDVMTKRFEGKKGAVKKLNAVKVEWDLADDGRPVNMREVKNSEFSIDADIVLLAMGFTGAEEKGLMSELGVKFDRRGNIEVDSNYMTSVKGVFAAGDVSSGASLVVRAINAGRELADSVNAFLKK